MTRKRLNEIEKCFIYRIKRGNFEHRKWERSKRSKPYFFFESYSNEFSCLFLKKQKNLDSSVINITAYKIKLLFFI